MAGCCEDGAGVTGNASFDVVARMAQFLDMLVGNSLVYTYLG